MTSTEDLIWLYKMAVEFNLEAEIAWLKKEIEDRCGQQIVDENSEEPIAA